MVLAILGLLGAVPIFLRGWEATITARDLEEFVAHAVADTVVLGHAGVLHIGGQRMQYNDREITWNADIGRLETDDSDTIVLYRNGTSSLGLTLWTSRGEIALLSLPRW